MRDIETEKRILIVGLLLERKPPSFVLQFIAQKWDLEQRQAYNYIRLARKEWQKNFKNNKRAGMGYHLAKRKTLYDKLMEQEDYRGALEVSKDESKLLGVYPTEKHDVNIKGELEVNSKLDKKLALLDINELKKLSKGNIKANAIKEQ